VFCHFIQAFEDIFLDQTTDDLVEDESIDNSEVQRGHTTIDEDTGFYLDIPMHKFFGSAQSLDSQGSTPDNEGTSEDIEAKRSSQFARNSLIYEDNIPDLLKQLEQQFKKEEMAETTEEKEDDQQQRREEENLVESALMGSTPILKANMSPPRQGTQEEAEWAIREGQAPVPDWAKRSAENDNSSDGSPGKRLKMTRGAESGFRTFVLRSTPNVLASGSGASSGYYSPVPTLEYSANAFSQPAMASAGPPPAVIHPIDQLIMDIANDHQFLPIEVRTYYDRTGDMEATKQRFAKLRMMINAAP